MKARARMALGFLILLQLLISNGRSYSAAPAINLKRLRFQVVTVKEQAENRTIISEASIEGLAGTDFTINLQAGLFKMSAKFLTDLIDPDTLKIRAKLDTRRLFGYSERNLPLYEEDAQNQALQMGFDEQIILLPFGRNGGEETLKIEITPTLSDQPAFTVSGHARPPEIKIIEPGPGIISIQAGRIPHNYEAEIVLLEDGREVARAAGKYLIGEPQEAVLEPGNNASPEVIDNPLAVNLTVNQYSQGRPLDQVFIGYDLHRTDRQNGGKRVDVASNWAAVVNLGQDQKIDLSDYYLKSSGKKYELKFKIKLAQGEIAD